MLASNAQYERMIKSLSNMLDRSDIVGYAAARNYRKISDCLTEFNDKKEELLEKYGVKETDSEGNLTGNMSINPTNPNYDIFMDSYNLYANIEHDVEIFKIKYDKVIGVLTGSEILEIDWMLED